MRRINTNNINTKEEKVASKIVTLLSDLTLDIEKIGFYMAINAPHIHYRRFIEVAESSEFQYTGGKLNSGGYYSDNDVRK